MGDGPVHTNKEMKAHVYFIAFTYLTCPFTLKCHLFLSGRHGHLFCARLELAQGFCGWEKWLI